MFWSIEWGWFSCIPWLPPGGCLKGKWKRIKDQSTVKLSTCDAWMAELGSGYLSLHDITPTHSKLAPVCTSLGSGSMTKPLSQVHPRLVWRNVDFSRQRCNLWSGGITESMLNSSLPQSAVTLLTFFAAAYDSVGCTLLKQRQHITLGKQIICSVADFSCSTSWFIVCNTEHCL